MRADRPPHRGSQRLRWVCSAAVAGVLTLTSCGLPRDGTVHKVDDRSVPYRLLESDAPSAGSSTGASEIAHVPVVLWITEDRLVPEATDNRCSDPPVAAVTSLLATLAAGPSDEGRAAGRSSALPPDAGLRLVRMADGTAQVDIEPETSLSAERLPVAMAQVVLAVTSVPSVRAVSFVSDGEPIQIPLPGGLLTDGPVTAEDYAELLPDRFDAPGDLGCPAP